jgi:hypothetical protein
MAGTDEFDGEISSLMYLPDKSLPAGAGVFFKHSFYYFYLVQQVK